MLFAFTFMLLYSFKNFLNVQYCNIFHSLKRTTVKLLFASYYTVQATNTQQLPLQDN
jgi:hypothetical protein